MQIDKVSYNPKEGRVHIEWTKTSPKGAGEYAMTHAEKPRPEFLKSLAALAMDVIEICECDGHWNESDLEVRGASFSWTEGVMGATITALRKLRQSNAPLVVNTPHKPAQPYAAGGDDSNCLSEECVERLTTLMDEARKYINGERAQGELFTSQQETSREN